MGPVLWAVNATIAVVVLAWVASVPMAIDWPSLGTPAPLNALMLLATPIDGGHYFVDVFAGIAIALVAWFAARAFAAYETAPHLAIRGRLFVSR